MSATTWIVRLEAWAQEEIGAQQRLLDLLGSQERAALANDSAALVVATQGLDRELAAEPARERRRLELVRGLGTLWGVASGALTLGSIAERAGADGVRLRRLRDDLEARATAVRESARRLAALAGLRRNILAELIHCVAGGDDRESVAGNLVQVEG